MPAANPSNAKPAGALARSPPGTGLREGHIVITGSIVPPVPVRPGDRVRFDLEPVGGVEVRFVGS